MPQGVLIIGKSKELISVAEVKPTRPQQLTVMYEAPSLAVNAAGPAAGRSMPRAGYSGVSAIELGESRFRVILLVGRRP